ncbi:Hsp20/alpha crystallin family protein [Noviherbaspirillum pedocola]|uniref:Hsp20/alpha crystallin family protein n=1 Tax=Noviherbaspirillum pedocola TaxID=2801341 RepID=A0A934T0F7_9BURK|nr:Hsp20/alpha crystallin family protein [Noviherbaspirillum pedocola]MBK4739147.1 Hsp20/alpha crystallin family protein [Noviherbaspirillum pedocola]
MSDNANITKHGNGQDVAKSAAKDTKQALIPPVDVIEDSTGITLFADLPGVPKDKLSLHLETNRLTIEGEMALDLPEQMESRFAEIDTPRYQRSFALSKDLDSDKATAELKNGVLRLHIPKAAHLQPRRIQISTA